MRIALHVPPVEWDKRSPAWCTSDARAIVGAIAAPDAPEQGSDIGEVAGSATSA